MSGQSLIDVVSTIVHTMSVTPTLSSELQSLVYHVDQHCSHDRMDWKKHLRSHFCPVLVALLLGGSRHGIVDSYLYLHRHRVKLTFDVDDLTSLRTEYTEFKSFLEQHVHSCANQLVEAGIHHTTAKEIESCERYAPWSRCTHLTMWNDSRVKAGRPDVSLMVWFLMSDMLESLYTPFYDNRVYLSDEESVEILSEALRRKRIENAQHQANQSDTTD